MFGSNWVKLFNKLTVLMDDVSITKQTVFRLDDNVQSFMEKQDAEIKALREELRRRTDYYENLLMTVIQNQILNSAKPPAPKEEGPKKSSLEAYLANKKSNGGLPLPG